MMARIYRSVGLGLSLLTLLACGYSLVGTGSYLPADIKSIYVAPLENKTLQPQVDQILTRAITEEFVTRRRYDIVNSADAADAELVGAVTGYAVNPVAFDNEGRATQYELSITLALTFQRTKTNPPQVLWASDRYVFRKQYEVEVSESGFFDPENLAIEDVAQDFARSLVIDILEGF